MVRLLLLTLLAVAGCASPPPLVITDPAVAPSGPPALIGWWRVGDAGPTVLIDPATIEVLDGGVAFTGTWRADPDDRLVAHLDTGRSVLDLADPPELTPPWLAAAVAFRVEGSDRVLLDRAGAPTARLVPLPPTAGSGAVDPGRPPAAEEQRAAGPAAPVAAPLRPAAPDELAGRWTPTGVTAPAFVELAVDGTWTGSDGCNGTAGRWVGGADGGFLSTGAGVHTLIACDGGVDVGAQLAAARRAAVDGAQLVLLDVGGAVAGRFSR
jgi:hypothetical protein